MAKFVLGLVLFLSSSANASLVESLIEYRHKGQVMEGFLVYDSSVTGKRPAAVVVHDWMGLGDFVKEKSRELARQGYMVLAADVYGKGIRASNAEEAGKLATIYKSDRKLFRERLKAAYQTLAKQSQTDTKKMIAMGFCFGGTAALEMARSGLNLKGVISYHGGLDSPTPQDAKAIKAKVLVLHGAIDPYVSEQELAGFYKEMNDAKVDYQFISYSGTVHSFTQPHAGSDISKGAAYNEVSARRAFVASDAFLKEVLN